MTPTDQPGVVPSAPVASAKARRWRIAKVGAMGLVVLLGIFAWQTCREECSDDPAFGTFGPLPKMQLESGSRVDRLLDEFTFTTRDGQQWKARAGLGWDGASIPQLLWSIAGSPKTGCYRFASIVHDEVYKNREEYIAKGVTREQADDLFYLGCRAKGVVEARARMMYYALRWFGDRWGERDLPNATGIEPDDPEELLRRLEARLQEPAEPGIRILSDAPADRARWADNAPPRTLLAALRGR
jgi:hypothetical protein